MLSLLENAYCVHVLGKLFVIASDTHSITAVHQIMIKDQFAKMVLKSEIQKMAVSEGLRAPLEEIISGMGCKWHSVVKTSMILISFSNQLLPTKASKFGTP